MSWASRLAIAPDRYVVSRAAVVSTWSTTSLTGERGKLVSAIVVAPCRRAVSRTSMTSVVVPLWEMPTATSPRLSRAAEGSAMWMSDQQ